MPLARKSTAEDSFWCASPDDSGILFWARNELRRSYPNSDSFAELTERQFPVQATTCASAILYPAAFAGTNPGGQTPRQSISRVG